MSGKSGFFEYVAGGDSDSSWLYYFPPFFSIQELSEFILKDGQWIALIGHPSVDGARGSVEFIAEFNYAITILFI